MAASDSLSGSWTGRYDYDNVAYGTPVTFDAVLTETGATLRGEVVEPNSFRDDCADTLLAVLIGTRQGSRVQFLKTYTDFDNGEPPLYVGHVNPTATRIAGRWHFPMNPGVKGTFLLARTAQAAVRRTTSATVERVIDA
ncbi:hypothetical protein [Thalassorhabdomicrobium marinisediminis]|uniref:Lipocalin-like domain-containing protein n=1 Tax=Thalassorhabdomicrobium marinisediminis TaxID=2170577 RepID=A0A2T7G059_9RHOB|nr:hypothetical protein [Thalassorhabdomicrobium marinisediminis]PVA07768.1 hypothetical protein DC363_03850 [Thalassorhabdomicrobium marinisediminis]